MTLDRLGRWRLPVLAVTALVLALVVIAAILLVGRIGTPDTSPSPTATLRTSPSGASDDTPEAAVRAFFEAFAEARETSDPAVIEPFVNGTGSSAYLTAVAFLQGQAEQGKERKAIGKGQPCMNGEAGEGQHTQPEEGAGLDLELAEEK